VFDAFFSTNSYSCLRTCCLLALWGTVVSSLELLSNRKEFQCGGVFDWSVLNTCYFLNERRLVVHVIFRIMDSYQATIFAVLARIVGATFFVACDSHLVAMLSLIAVVLGTLFLHFRCVYGLDGADQMGLIVIATVALCEIGDRMPAIVEVGLWFIACQSCLSYTTAGIAKLVSPTWRSGRAISGVLGTNAYGLWGVGTFLERHALLCKIMAWSVFLPECLFYAALCGDFRVTTAFLAWGIVFHLSAALIMGLNGFVWSFIATYPAIIYCSSAVYHLWLR
jgi:hypothetical protein